MDEYPKMLTKDGKPLRWASGPKAGEFIIVDNAKEEKAYKGDGIVVHHHTQWDTSHNK